MKYRVLSAFGLALSAPLWACSSSTSGGNANVIGAHALILMDELPGDGTLADPSADASTVVAATARGAHRA